jgi:RNA polymerase sigma-70 factor (ECF subfamily)
MDSRPGAQEYSDLIRRCADQAYNFAFRLSGSDGEARDLVQEAFTRAFEHWGRYDPSKPFEAWLSRILHNVYLDRVRRLEHTHSVSLHAPPPVEGTEWEDLLPGGDPEPIESLMTEERSALLQRALNALPEHYRAAVALCDMEDFSYERISEVMDCPVGTVRSRVHQGRVLLRKEFSRLSRKMGEAL